MGLLDDVRALRSAHWLPPIETVPEWVVYSLPDGMWLLSYMFAMEFIWNNDSKHIRLFFIWAMPVAIIAHEFCQLMGLASGTWDILDLTSYSIAIIIYLLTKKTIIMTQSMSLKLICSCIVAAVFVIGAASCATSSQTSKYQQALDKQLQQNGTSNSNESPTSN